MSARLHQVATFTDVADAATVQLPNLLHNAGGTAILPDLVFSDNGGFSIDSVTTTTITVTNNSGGVASLNVWLFRIHSADRAIGGAANLAPQPFIVASGGGGGGGGGTAQAFRYTATGVEGTDFNVTLPVARANDLYNVVAAMSGGAAIVAFDFPDILVGDRTTTQFRVVTSAVLTANDQIDFFVTDRT